MKLTQYRGTFPVACLRCGCVTHGEAATMYADLNGKPFEAYYHAKCLTGVEITEGLAAMQRAMDDSVSAYYQAHAGRYQGD